MGVFVLLVSCVPRHFLMVPKIALKFVKVVIFLKIFSTHLRTLRIGRYAPA